MLSSGELRRYSRHLLIPQVGLAGQQRLARSRVLVVGAGGLGSPVLHYLAAAGVGRIGIVDDDVVDLTNLQRQTIFSTADIGEKKAVAAAHKVRELNPHVAVDVYPVRFEAQNARDLVSVYDIVADCTDSFSTRYIVNDACVACAKPDVSASIFRFDGQLSVFATEDGPCYRCLYPEAPAPGTVPTCAEGGVLGVLAGMLGTLQAGEILKVLLAIGRPLIGRLLLLDALEGETKNVRFDRDPKCVMCGDSGRRSLFDAYEERDDAQVFEDDVLPEQLDDVLAAARLIDVREPHEMVLGIIDGALHVPASQFEARLHELDSAQAYVVACRVGVKSRWAMERLRDAGFSRVRHLRGGLLAYAAQRPEFAFF